MLHTLTIALYYSTSNHATIVVQNWLLLQLSQNNAVDT